ncbi:MAG: outer membrane lipoprotein-sorting protein [Sphaerochaeta sp.]
MKNKILKKLFISLVVLLTIQIGISAQTSYSAQQIIDNVYNRATPSDQLGELTMTLVNSRGNERVRVLKQYIKEDEDETKKIMFFMSPADVRGTSFMTFSSDEDENDSQWIYLPALKKVKRISSGNSSDYFMGSDFTYDDMGERLPSEDVHSIIGEDTINGVHSIKIQSIPKDKDYMYSKTITWVSDELWIGLKKEFYDEDGELLKTLSVLEYKEIDGYWLITSSQMYNIQSEHKTSIQLNDSVLDSGINDSIFTTRTMERGIR